MLLNLIPGCPPLPLHSNPSGPLTEPPTPHPLPPRGVRRSPPPPPTLHSFRAPRDFGSPLGCSSAGRRGVRGLLPSPAALPHPRLPLPPRRIRCPTRPPRHSPPHPSTPRIAMFPTARRASASVLAATPKAPHLSRAVSWTPSSTQQRLAAPPPRSSTPRPSTAPPCPTACPTAGLTRASR